MPKFKDKMSEANFRACSRGRKNVTNRETNRQRNQFWRTF